jgi:hypothetical protein
VGKAPTGSSGGAPYNNPLRYVRSLQPSRIDQGVDYTGEGPVYAIGPAVVVQTAPNTAGGWPGGGFIAYRLTDGPDAGQYVYVAENVTPKVRVGDRVDWTTQIADMHGPIETGWAAPPPNLGLALAGVLGQFSGENPTPLGENFNRLMVTLGAPSGTGPGSKSPGSGPPLPAGGGGAGCVPGAALVAMAHAMLVTRRQ